MKKASFKFHNVRVIFNESHFKIKTCVFVDMTRGAVFLGAINISRCEYLLEYSHHNLLIELWAGRKICGVPEILYWKNCSTSFSIPSDDRVFRAHRISCDQP